MSIAMWRKALCALPTALITLCAFLGTLLPPCVSRAAPADAVGGVPIGTGGSSSLGDSVSGANTPEAFASVDLSTGAAHASYPFRLVRARGDAQPSLSLRYSSSAGVGFAGVGWTLDLPSIVRKGHAGIPRFTDPAVYAPALLANPNIDDYYIDGRLLIPVANGVLPPALLSATNRPWASFRREVDDGARYFFDGQTWIQQTKSGHSIQFGYPLDLGPPAVELVDPITTHQISGLSGEGSSNIYRWNLARDTDTSGNTVYFVWDNEQQLFPGRALTSMGIQYLTDIYDTSSAPQGRPAFGTFAHHTHLTWSLPQYPAFPFTVLFTGQGGGDQSTTPYGNSPIWKAIPFAQLAAVDVTSATWQSATRQLVRRYALSYLYNGTQTRSYLNSIQMIGDCDQHGGPFSEDDSGHIVNDTATAEKVQGCANAEGMPPTTYNYWGIAAAPIGAAPPPPQIIQETTAYEPTMPAEALVDLNGDGAAELVTGNFGFGTHTPLNCVWTCSANAGDVALVYLTLGFVGNLGSCGCPGYSVTGPTQAPISNFPHTVSSYQYGLTTGQNSTLTTLLVDDAMWSFGVLGDWGSTGGLSLLQLVPPGYNNGAPGLLYLNGSANPIYGGQFVFNKDMTIAFAPVSIPDAQVLAYDNGFNSGPPTGFTAGSFKRDRALDVDGDGLPDMTLVPLNSGATTGFADYSTFFTTRDRNGQTHPFSLEARQLGCALASFDPTTSVTYALINTLPGGNSGVASSQAQRAMADIDGDGLKDLLLVNKYADHWGTNAAAAKSGSGSSGPPLSYLGLTVLLNRGDGRFGIVGPGGSPCSNDSGLAIMPGTSGESPQANQGPAVGPDGIGGPGVMLQFGDLNGDGMDDYALLDSTGLTLCLRYGGWWDSARWQCVNDPTKTSTGAQDFAHILIGDLDGSGINQVLYVPPADTFRGQPGIPTAVRAVTPNREIILGVVQREGLLKSVSNGLGATTTFDNYATLKSLNLGPAPVGPLPVPAWAVTQSTTTNGLRGNQFVSVETDYTYDTPIYDPRDRQYVGFHSVTETRSGGLGAVSGGFGSPGLVTKTTFATDTCASTGVNVCLVGEDYSATRVRRGLPVVVETSENSPAGTKVSTIVHDYTYQSPYTGLDGRVGRSLQSVRTHTYLWGDVQTPFQGFLPVTSGLAPFTFKTVAVVSLPLGGTELLRQRAYDVNGNETSVLDFGAVGRDKPILQINQWQLPAGDQSGWNYRMTQSLRGYTVGFGPGQYSGTEIGLGSFSGAVREYDQAFDPLGRLIQVSSGPLSGVPALPTGHPSLPGSGTFGNGLTPTLVYRGYDRFGNVTSVGSDNVVCKTQIAYDPWFNQLPSLETDYPNGCDDFTGALATNVVYDRRFGVRSVALSPAGQLTSWQYDDFGRIVEVDSPHPQFLGKTTPSAMINYVDASPVSSETFYTADGTPVGVDQAPSLWVGHARYYDGLGAMRAALDQSASDAWVLSGVRSSYQNGRTKAVYKPWSTSLTPSTFGTGLPSEVYTPPLATPSATVTAYDSSGRELTGTDFNGSGWSKVYRDSALAVETYDQEQTNGAHQGAYTTDVKDGHGRLAYHIAGNPLANNVTAYTYQATGEPTTISQSSGSQGGATRTLTYDSLGRMTTNTEPGVGTWTYWHDFDGRIVGTQDARGCGQDNFYDAMGRIVAKDYIPCGAPGQTTYTKPDTSTGKGTEAFYVYGPDGLLSDVYDLASHVGYSYDGRGRVQLVTRALASPNPPSALSSRYDAKVYSMSLSYDLADRVTNRSVGYDGGTIAADATTYTYDGRATTITGGGGGYLFPADYTKTLLSAALYNADGTTRELQYGDVSGTTADFAYDGLNPPYVGNGFLTTYNLHRNQGAGVNGSWSSAVSPPAPDGSTTEADLALLAIAPDLVGNPLIVTDSSTAAWPDGAKPSSTKYTYDDNYRLTSVTTISSPDRFVSPYSFESSQGNASPYALPADEANRVQGQSFAYDFRGNITSWTDDSANVPDRSLGAVVTNAQLSNPGAIAVAAGGNQSCAVLSDGRAQCWGSNDNGQLGDGTKNNSPSPVFVSSLSNAIAISTGQYHSCALIAGGGAKCWGANGYGDLGDGTTKDSEAPVPVQSLSGATAIGAGAYHTCALLSDATVDCWGLSNFGQTGTAGSLVPTAVPGLLGVTALSTALFHNCALLSDGTVKCWGWNAYGQLGGNADSSGMVTVALSQRAIAIGAAGTNSCAALSDGTVQCWGDNRYGQLGNGTPGNPPTSSTPITVSGVTGATAVAVGTVHACATVAGGALMCWGYNNSGEFGDGTTASPTPPVSFTVSGATAIAIGEDHACGLLSNGAVQCWGAINGSATPVTAIAGGGGVDNFGTSSTPGTTAGVTAFYDAAGNMTEVINLSANSSAGPRYDYQWDEVGRLVRAQHTNNVGAIVADQTYVYDTDGNRIRTDDNLKRVSTANAFDMLVSRDLTSEAGPAWSPPTSATAQVYLGGGLAHLFQGTTEPGVDASGMRMYMRYADPRGSNAFVIDSDSGEVVERTVYQAYGALDADYRPTRWNSHRENYKLTGNWDNAEVGLVYMNNRYYAPELGRFISPDPLTVHALAGDPNPYAYAFGNPIKYADPSGLDGSDYNVESDPTSVLDPNTQPTTSGETWGTPWDLEPESVSGDCDLACEHANAASVADAKTIQEMTWVDPTDTSSRWNPHATASTQAMLLGTEGPPPLEPQWSVFAGNIRNTVSYGMLAASVVVPILGELRAVAEFGAAEGLSTAGRAAQLADAIPAAQAGRITMGVGLAEDATGARSVLIGTSEPGGYLRPGVTLAPGEMMAAGAGHAEADIVAHAQASGLRLLEVGATRPICPTCAGLIRGAGATPVTRLKGVPW